MKLASRRAALIGPVRIENVWLSLTGFTQFHFGNSINAHMNINMYNTSKHVYRICHIYLAYILHKLLYLIYNSSNSKMAISYHLHIYTMFFASFAPSSSKATGGKAGRRSLMNHQLHRLMEEWILFVEFLLDLNHQGFLWILPRGFKKRMYSNVHKSF